MNNFKQNNVLSSGIRDIKEKKILKSNVFNPPKYGTEFYYYTEVINPEAYNSDSDRK